MTVLPRLLYVGDVAVESSYHGSTLLYRLLQQYPPDRLMIVEGNLFPPRTDRRLPGVTYTTLHVGRRRLLDSRAHDWYSRWLLAGAARRASRIPALLSGFAPQAVMTVGHAYSWLTAARFARHESLPLLFVAHDDWPRAVAAPLRNGVDRAFGDVYRQAAARLCSSPFMAEDYERRYGVPGTVLLPYRAPDAKMFNAPAERVGRVGGAPTFVFAGTINSPGYADLLRRLARSIARRDGQLLIFGPIDPRQAAAAGLDRPNVRLGGLLEAADLLDRLRREADVLFVPMSFAAEDQANMRMGFPSKLTDYTAAGLPLLICGPSYCSAVRWAADRAGVAEVVASEDPAALDAAVDRLVRDSAHRMALAATAQRIGDRDFSAVTAAAVFRRALTDAVTV